MGRTAGSPKLRLGVALGLGMAVPGVVAWLVAQRPKPPSQRKAN